MRTVIATQRQRLDAAAIRDLDAAHPQLRASMPRGARALIALYPVEGGLKRTIMFDQDPYAPASAYGFYDRNRQRESDWLAGPVASGTRLHEPITLSVMPLEDVVELLGDDAHPEDRLDEDAGEH